ALPEPGELERSAAGERLDVEGDDDEVVLLEDVGQAYRLTAHVHQRTLGRGGAHGERRRRIGGASGGGEREQREREKRRAPHVAAGASARRTASRKLASGSAPSNSTRSLITIFGTALTR